MTRSILLIAMVLTLGACAAEHPHHGGGWKEDLHDHHGSY